MTAETDHIPTTDAEPGAGWTSYEESARDESVAPQPAYDESLDAEPARDELPGLAPDESESPAAAPAAPHAGGDALLTAEAESDLRSRWNAIQVSFVEDPRTSVEDADALIQEIATALIASLQERRSELAAAWQDGAPDTEQLRLALRQYRSFMGVVLPA